MRQFSWKTILKGSIISPLVVPVLLSVHFIFASQESLVVAVVLLLGTAYGYAVFLLTAFPVYLRLRNRAKLKLNRFLVPSSFFGLVFVGPLTAYLLKAGGVVLSKLDVLGICGLVAVITLMMSYAFFAIATKFENQNSF